MNAFSEAELDPDHEVLATLGRLLPEAVVAGGSFAGWLPDPRSLAAAERARILASAQASATDQCIRTLLQRVGLSSSKPVASGHGGAREWPAGFVGSLTHKGTVVAGAIAPTSAVKLIGIDVERMGRDDLGGIETEVAADGLAPGMERGRARLLSFSSKEAVFKAQYPMTRRRLDFSDVTLLWEFAGDQNVQAEVKCPVKGLVIRASFVGRWVVAAALSPNKIGI